MNKVEVDTKRNEKLALWRGFKPSENTYGLKYPTKVKNRYVYPDNTYTCANLPNFSESADLCIKWLLPKVDGLEGVLFWPTTEGLWWSMSVIDIPFEGDTLAEAIEKYVDWQSEEE